MANLRKPEDDDPQYKEIGLEGVGQEVSQLRQDAFNVYILFE